MIPDRSSRRRFELPGRLPTRLCRGRMRLDEDVGRGHNLQPRTAAFDPKQTLVEGGLTADIGR